MLFEFLHRKVRQSERVALFPGAYNPPTVAHVEIARAALDWAGEVVWVLPRTLPHKALDAADFAYRCEMLGQISNINDAFSVATTAGGLFSEIAAEGREALGPSPEISLVCGRDAAQRAADWDYGRPGAFDQFLAEYRMLVADRSGGFQSPEYRAGRVIRLNLRTGIADDVSSTEVRRRMEQGLPWEHLVPPAIAEWNKLSRGDFTTDDGIA